MSRVVLLLCVVATVAHPQAGPLQRGVVVQPDSVTVGDPFRVVIRVRAPRGTVLEFPQGPDSSYGVEALDRLAVALGADTLAVEQTATYRLAAWDVGRLPIRFPDIIARAGRLERRIAVGGLAIHVVSVLPADSAERVPKPVRAPFEFGVPWWYWLIVALVAAVLGTLFWWWWHRRPRSAAQQRDPYDDALRAFDHIDSLGLVAAGEGGHYITLCADVVRSYLGRVVPAARAALTTSELNLALRGSAAVPAQRLVRALHEIDLVKFARQATSPERASALGLECRSIVVAVHEAQQTVTQARAA